jgi:hypothetical protein
MSKGIGEYVVIDGCLYFHVEHDTTVRATYQIACDYTDIAIKAGHYPATITDINYRKTYEAHEIADRGAYYVSWGCPGVVVESYFPTLLGGVQIGNFDRTKETGRATHYNSGGVYTYQIREMVLAQIAEQAATA